MAARVLHPDQQSHHVHDMTECTALNQAFRLGTAMDMIAAPGNMLRLTCLWLTVSSTVNRIFEVHTALILMHDLAGWFVSTAASFGAAVCLEFEVHCIAIAVRFAVSLACGILLELSNHRG